MKITLTSEYDQDGQKAELVLRPTTGGKAVWIEACLDGQNTVQVCITAKDLFRAAKAFHNEA